MSDNITIQITHDEALVLSDFLARFARTDNFELAHNAEFIVFSKIAGQLESALVEPFKLDYESLLSAARERLAEGYEGVAPGVKPQ